DHERRVVGLLDAINEGPALQGHSADVVAHLGMGIDPLDRHGEIQLDPVAWRPAPLDVEIAAVPHYRIEARAIEGERLAFGPTRDAKLQREVGGRLGMDSDRDLARPGEVALLPKADGLAANGKPGAGAPIEMDGDRVVAS